MLFRLENDHPCRFPPPALAEPDGLLAVGGDLSPERLAAAYGAGIFPWFSEPPYLWWSPDPRCVLLPENLHVPRRLERMLRSGRFIISMNTAFAAVCHNCARSPRPGQNGTWITDEMQKAYLCLHEHGLAHSVEAWEDGTLVGGMYGVRLGAAFCGESMFYRVADASKVAFVTFARWFFEHGGQLIDCQQESPHMLRFGAASLPREDFLGRLHRAIQAGMRGAPFPAGSYSAFADA